jgi:hypothetical protein
VTISRRTFLKQGLGIALAIGPMATLFANPLASTILGCRSNNRGQHFLSAVSADGKPLFDVLLPGRGHGICVQPGKKHLAVLARRPQDFMWVIDVESAAVTHKISSPDNRHFYGHGIFEPSGRFLFTTENAFSYPYQHSYGVIGVYDSRDNFRRVDELPSHGIGPHELKLLNDGKTLVVANGGILTHPDTGRNKLNLDTMDPNLAYIDTANGALLGQYRPEKKWHQLSMRHLDVSKDDTVCVVSQYQGPGDQQPPLVAIHKGEDQARWLNAPGPIQQGMQNYCGSVSCDSSGTLAAVTSPRGNLVTLWSLADGSLHDSFRSSDTCGVASAAIPGGFYLSNGEGTVMRMQYPDIAATQPLLHLADAHWDNHLTLL